MSSNPTGTLSGLHAWLGSRSILSIAARIEGIGLAEATYVFDPGTFIEGEQTRQMQYRPTIESDFSVLVVFHPEGRVETFKYLGSELICKACGTARAKSNGSILSGLAPVATRRDGDGQEN